MFSRRATLRRFLGDLFFFGVLHSIFSVAVYAVSRDFSVVALSFWLFLPFLAMSLTRLYANRFWLFFLLHFLLVAWPFWLPAPLVWKATAFLFMLACGIYSVTVRLSGGWRAETGVVFFAVGVNVVLMLIMEYFALGAVDGVLTGWAFLFILWHFIYVQTLRVDSSLGILSHRTRQPVGTIVRFNNLILLFFLLLVCAFSLLSGALPLPQIAKAIPGVLLFLARLIYRLLLFLLPGSSAQEPAESGSRALPPGFPAAQPSSLFWLILEQIFHYLISTLLITATLVGIGYLCLMIYRKFYAPRQVDGELREFVSPDSALEGLRSAMRSFLRYLPVFGWSERERIRRDYYQKVRCHIRRGAVISKVDTTGEIKEKLRDNEDLSALTALYDEARYGREDSPPGR